MSTTPKSAAKTPSAARSVDNSDRSGSTVMVLLVALVLVGAALFFLAVGRERAYPYVMALLALLSVTGVFALFAYAAGIFRLANEEGRNDFTKALADGAPDATIVVEPSGRVVYANSAYIALTGASGPESVRGVERAFTSDPNLAEAIYRLSQASREGRRHQEEVRVAESGSARWLRFKVRPLVTEGVKPPRGADSKSAVWSIADVTRERANAETAFETLQKTIDFLDHAPVGFFSVGAEGAIDYMNATLATWLDHDLAQVGSGGLGLPDILAGEGASLVRSIAPAPGDVKVHMLDLDLRTRSGQTLPVKLLHKVAYGADGAVGSSRTIVINRARDATMGDSLRAAEVRFARFFNNSPLGIATVDATGRVMRENPIFARLAASVPMAEDGVRRLTDLVTGEARAELAAALSKAAGGASDVPPHELQLAGSGTRWARFFVAPVDETEDGGEAAIVYAFETTEQRQLQAEYTQSQKMFAIGQLAGGVAHDFNNVLQAISGHADLLLLTHKPSDPAFADIMEIKQNSNRAASLVRHLLAFSRKQTLRPQVVQLGEVLSDLSMMLRRTIGDRVVLDMVHGRDLWPVKADTGQIENAIINLSVNARDAMPDGGRLTIRTANVAAADLSKYRVKGQPMQMPDLDQVMIDVVDTGTGIPPEILKKIFEPFFSTKEIGKGTGLGLSSVYGIIKQSGGYVFVESEVGKGTTFRIFLPRWDGAEEAVETMPEPSAKIALPTAAAAAPRETAPVALADWTKAAAKVEVRASAAPVAPVEVDPVRDGPPTILLVDDEASVRVSAARFLGMRGYRVLEAESGRDALEVLAADGGPVDLVVSDVLMPDMNGPQLVAELAKSRADLKVVFVSGYADDAFKENLPPGVRHAFLPKPFQLKDLLETVKQQIGR